MAETSRFPHLALPFALVGAAGGWLSAGLAGHPLVQRVSTSPRGAATVVAAGLTALAGTLMTRWCTRPDAPLYLGEAEGEARPASDSWPRHALCVLVTGALTGGLVAGICNVFKNPLLGALGGVLCALAFLPVCLAVIAAARRAMRARLGSLVSESDRRAVWSILATALSVATLEALPSWPGAATHDVPAPLPAVLMLVVSAALVAGVLVYDAIDLRRAKQALAPGLEARDPTDTRASEADAAAARLDLGLGDDLAARVARTSAAYRGKDRTLALVKGDANQALSALRRALARGGLCLGVIALVAGAHVLARGDQALRMYSEARCEDFHFASCERLADTVREERPTQALLLYEKACSKAQPQSCHAAAELHERAAVSSLDGDWEELTPGREKRHRELAASFFLRACGYGDQRDCIPAKH
jgi:hypothetical protein